MYAPVIYKKQTISVVAPSSSSPPFLPDTTDINQNYCNLQIKCHYANICKKYSYLYYYFKVVESPLSPYNVPVLYSGLCVCVLELVYL